MMWKTCKRFANAVTWKNLFRKIAGEIIAGRVGGVKSSQGFPSETPRPPMRIFYWFFGVFVKGKLFKNCLMAWVSGCFR